MKCGWLTMMQDEQVPGEIKSLFAPEESEAVYLVDLEDDYFLLDPYSKSDIELKQFILPIGKKIKAAIEE